MHKEKAMKILHDALSKKPTFLSCEGVITNINEYCVLTIEIPVYGTVYARTEEIKLEVYSEMFGFKKFNEFIGMVAVVYIHEDYVYLSGIFKE